MDLLHQLLSLWGLALTPFLFSLIDVVNARAEATLLTFLGRVLLTEEKSILEFSKMEAESPGMSTTLLFFFSFLFHSFISGSF